jgi:hypothetical protein
MLHMRALLRGGHQIPHTLSFDGIDGWPPEQQTGPTVKHYVFRCEKRLVLLETQPLCKVNRSMCAINI